MKGKGIKENEEKLMNQATDIRKLANYKELEISKILFRRKEVIVPLIKEAIKAGYIQPL